MNLREFLDNIDALSKDQRDNDITIEDYLRALWTQLQENRDAQPSLTLFTNMLAQSFIAAPAPFVSAWSNVTKPPDFGLKGNDDLADLEQVLIFQIADLHGMGDENLKDPQRYLGLQSPTGNSWYNFDPATYLECATSGIRANSRGKELESDECAWELLANLLELGRLYE